MSDMQSPGWFLKKENGDLYGPGSLDMLVEWAMDGRVAPEDFVSDDGVRWLPAYNLSDLDMSWFIETAAGQRYGPAHAAAFADMMNDGTLPPDIRVVHVHTGEVMTLVQLAARQAAAVRMDRGPADEAPTTAEAAPMPAAAPDRTLSWQAVARERDRLEREAAKWRSLCEKEQTEVTRLDRELKELQRTREQDRISAQTMAEHMEREILTLKRQQEEMARGAPGGDAGLFAAYRDLTRNYEILADRFTSKADQLQTAEATMEDLRNQYEERLRVAEEQLARERHAHNTARRQLTDVEKSQLEIVQSFRDLNDRYVRLREQMSSSEPLGVAPAPEAPETPIAGGPRVRLRR